MRQQGRVAIDRSYQHVPQSVSYRTVIYSAPRDYYTRIDQRYIYRQWIQDPAYYTYSNGYSMIDGYPYYVDQGYRYRYSPVEYCRYQLVDGSSYTAVKSYGLQICSVSYDTCSYEKDGLNRYESYNRYFCAENVDQDLYSTDDNYYGYGNYLSYQKQQEISDFLWSKTDFDLFRDASLYGVGQCTIRQTPLSRGGDFIVYVNAQIYPKVDGSISSSSYSAARMNCNVGAYQDNAGCILRAAVQEGLCL